MNATDPVGFGLPVGFRFDPSDQELLMYYLRRKLLGQPCSYKIVEKKIYGEKANPWELFTECDSICRTMNQEISYVFTKLAKVAQGKKNISRVAGCGKWNGSTGAKSIAIDDIKVGYKKTFTFKSDDCLDAKGRWIMHEYTLCGAGLEGIQNNDYVVCKVIKNVSKDLKNSSAAASTEDIFSKNSESEVLSNLSQDLGKRKSRLEDDYISREKKMPRVDSVEDCGCVSGGEDDQYLSDLEAMLFADSCLNLDDVLVSGHDFNILSSVHL